MASHRNSDNDLAYGGMPNSAGAEHGKSDDSSEGPLGWRDEIDIVLQDWIAALGGGQGEQRWRRVGVARPTTEAGVYVVDIRATNLNADQSDNLRLAGPENRNVEAGFRVMEATFEGELVRIRVAEFADFAEPYLWQLRQEPAFLITNLCDKFRELKDAGLANLLARGEIGGILGAVDPPPGWKIGQQEAYRACLGTGVWLVWGPPGTGKTRVIRGAVSDLLTEGKRVLLVSGTNIAVDNALAGVLRERRHQPGDIVRVGPPQLPEIINNPEISLPLIVQARLAEVEEQRRAAAEDLLDMNRRQERLRGLEARLEGFDRRPVRRSGGPACRARKLGGRSRIALWPNVSCRRRRACRRSRLRAGATPGGGAGGR